MMLSHSDSGGPADERQQQRLRDSAIVVAIAAFQAGIMGLFAVAGTVPAWVAAAFFAAGTGSALLLYALVRRGWNLRFQEKDFIASALLINAIVQLSFLLLVPQLTIFFMFALFMSFGQAAVRFTPGQFTIGWLLYGLCTGFALLAVRGRFAYPGKSNLEIELLWLFFFIALRCFTFANAQLNALRERLSKTRQELDGALSRIEELASHDPLTGVLNRRSLSEMLEAELQRSHRTGHPFSFAIIDLDRLGALNEKHGRAVGDAILKSVADSAMQSLRTLDRFGRLRDGRFGIILPATWLDHGMIAIDRLTKAVASRDWERTAPGLSVTFSTGITTNAPQDTAASITERAETALLQAKQNGAGGIVQMEEGLPAMPPVDPDD